MEHQKPTDFTHHYHRRGHNINYHGPGVWHVIIKKGPGAPDWSRLVGDPRIPCGAEGCARTVPMPLGRIMTNSLRELQAQFPMVRLLQYCIMPDHCPLLIQLTAKSEKPLGFYIGRLKTEVRVCWKRLSGIPSGEILPMPVFTEGYTDRIMHRGRDMKTMIDYIRQNPYRLAVRKTVPEFFTKARAIEVTVDHGHGPVAEKWTGYGNLFLLRNPERRAVVVHRRYDAETLARLKEEWLWEASHGGVLVSAFISKAEKEIRDLAEKEGGRLIHLQGEPFGGRFKPEGHRFELCTQGKLLILAPTVPLDRTGPREVFLHLNRVAEALATS